MKCGNAPTPPARFTWARPRWHAGTASPYGKGATAPPFPCNDWQLFRGATEHMRLVERFTRLDDATVSCELTATDPETFSSPWTLENSLTQAGGPVARVCLPRRQLWPDRHPRWGTRRREAVTTLTACRNGSGGTAPRLPLARMSTPRKPRNTRNRGRTAACVRPRLHPGRRHTRGSKALSAGHD